MGRPPSPSSKGSAVCEPSAPRSWRIELPHTTAAVPIARALIRTALAEIGEAPGGTDGFTAELLTAELVANAVEHTSGDAPLALVIELLPGPGGYQVEVHDHDPAPPEDLTRTAPPTEPDPWQEHGRGLLLIRALSSACGHRATVHGKAVWFTLPALPRQRGPQEP